MPSMMPPIRPRRALLPSKPMRAGHAGREGVIAIVPLRRGLSRHKAKLPNAMLGGIAIVLLRRGLARHKENVRTR